MNKNSNPTNGTVPRKLTTPSSRVARKRFYLHALKEAVRRIAQAEFHPPPLHHLRAALLSGLMALAGALTPAMAAQQPSGTVVDWGYNQFGLTNVPSGLTNVTAIAAGDYHCLAVKQDSTVIAWGGNQWGQANVPSGLSNVVAVAGGEDHSLALKQDGTVVAWPDPTVPSGLNGVVAVAAGAWHRLALKQDGTVVAWGNNAYGQANVPGGLNGVASIAAGGQHCLALKHDGTVVAWGSVIGPVSGPDWVPDSVPSGLSNLVAVAAGDQHSLALKRDGTVVAWGRIPDLSAPQGLTPATVPSGLSNVAAIAAGRWHSLALRQDGTVVAWGYNCCDGVNTVPSGLRGVVAMSAGFHNMALVDLRPPRLVSNPLTQTAEAGSAIRLPARADGAPILSYEWFLNGASLHNVSASPYLDLTNLQPSQAGAYLVVITNANGAVTSSPAMLSVIPPVPRRTVPAVFVSGPPGQVLHAEYSDSLGPSASWQPLGTVTGSGATQPVMDLSGSLPAARFYRAWPSSVRPAIQISMAAELTLTGTLGNNLRLDYIAQFGPTDAWVTLDTVTLTNTSQSYFDLTMFRQPARLYRLVPVP